MPFSSPDAQFRILSVNTVWRPSVDKKCDFQKDNRLIFFFRGCETEYNIGDEKLNIDNLTLLFIPKGISYTHTANREKVIYISFEASGEIPKKPFTVNSHIFVPLFRDLAFTWLSKPSGYTVHAYSVFFTILDLIHNMRRENAENPQYRSITAGVNYLHRNFTDPTVSIAHAASLCFLCERRFRDLYKAVFHITPKKAIIEMRVNHACKLLQQGHLSIAEVSDQAGFLDVKHFSRTFHSIISIPPSEYRDLFFNDRASSAS